MISDIQVMSDQQELFGLVAAMPPAWWTLAENARAGKRVTAAVGMARRHTWAQIAARLADKTLVGVIWPSWMPPLPWRIRTRNSLTPTSKARAII